MCMLLPFNTLYAAAKLQQDHEGYSDALMSCACLSQYIKRSLKDIHI